MVCRLDDQDTKLSPRKTQKPDVERRESGAACPVSVGVGDQLVNRPSADVADREPFT